MEYRNHRGKKISEIGVGCYALSGAYGSVNIKEFQAMINRAFELGVNFFDTAESYGNAEKILGETVKPYREQIHIATKVGIREGIKPNLSSQYIKDACARSLQQLQTDYIDLYQVHFDDPNTPVHETVEALESLVENGQIQSYGVGHLRKARVSQYCQVGDPFSILMELSAVARNARKDLLPVCKSEDVGAIAFSITGRGILTGRYKTDAQFEANDIRNMDPLFHRARFRSAIRIKDKFVELAQKYEKTAVQAAIAWVLAQPSIICALTGSSKIPHLEENLGGSGWSLSREDLEMLELMFMKEDKVLVEEENIAVRQILSAPLSASPTQAFNDLVYVLETSHNLGLLSENEALQWLQELWPIRKALDKSSRTKLLVIQKKLHALIG